MKSYSDKISKKTKYDLVKTTKRNNFKFLNETVCSPMQTVLFGDSITEIFNVTDLFYDYTKATGVAVYNRGISGDTSDRLLERIYDNVINIAPRNLVILTGTNDLGLGVSLDFTASYVDRILQIVGEKCPDTNVILEGIYPVNRNMSMASRQMVGCRKNSVIAEVNGQLSVLAQKYNVTFADFTDKLIDKKGRFFKEYTYDGLHPTAEGFKVIAENLMPLFK